MFEYFTLCLKKLKFWTTCSTMKQCFYEWVPPFFVSYDNKRASNMRHHGFMLCHWLTVGWKKQSNRPEDCMLANMSVNIAQFKIALQEFYAEGSAANMFIRPQGYTQCVSM